MANNLPFDINGFKQYLLNNMMNSQPKAKIGGGGGFSNARPINVKSIGTKAGTTIDDALNLLYGKAKQAGLGGLADAVEGGASKLAPMGMANPLVMGAMNIPMAIQNMKDIYGGESSRKNYEWAKSQMAGRGIKPALGSTKAPTNVAKPATQLKKVAIKPSGSNPSLPPLPSMAPTGSYPSYDQILKDAGVPIMDNFQPNASQAGQYAPSMDGSPTGGAVRTLADKLGMSGYVAPENISSPLAQERLQQIREYLGKYTPDAYRGELDKDIDTKTQNRVLDHFFGSDYREKIPTELERQAEVIKYLTQGYDTDMGLTTSGNRLAQAEAMSKATGLPSTWFEEPKDVLSNIVHPQISSQGQLDVAKQYGLNAEQVANLNNALKMYVANQANTLGAKKLDTQKEIANIMAGSKLAPAMIGALGGGMTDQETLMQLIDALGAGGGMNPNLIPSQTNFGNAQSSF